MVKALLELPTDVLLQILSFFPVKTLLRFSRASKSSYTLANSSLHTLSLTIYSTRVAAFITRVAAMDQPLPKQPTILFTLFQPQTSPLAIIESSENSNNELDFGANLSESKDPHHITSLINKGRYFDPLTLLKFHARLTESILIRNKDALRNLDLCLWTLTSDVAQTLASLPALRVVSIRIDSTQVLRAVPKSYIIAQHHEEDAAWAHLTMEAVWAPQLRALRIESPAMSEDRILALIARSRYCQEFWFRKCTRLSNGRVWRYLANQWQGRSQLRVLGIVSCGDQPPSNDLVESFEGLPNMQSLTID